MRHTTTLMIFVLMLLAAVTLDTADAPRIENSRTAFGDAGIRAPRWLVFKPAKSNHRAPKPCFRRRPRLRRYGIRAFPAHTR